MDGVEHSGMMKSVMAVAQIDNQNAPHILQLMVPKVGRDHRSDLTLNAQTDRDANRRR